MADDKPAGMVEIPDSLGRDLDNGRMPSDGMPIEEVLHPKTVEQLHRQASITDEPVRADKLQPITAAEAAARTTFNGETLPNMPRPRRVLPAPFRREGVRGGQHGKAWLEVPVSELTEGDMSADVGRVVLVTEEENGGRTIVGKGGLVRTFSAADKASVFRSKP